MGEAKWLAATDPAGMVKVVRREGSDRKLRLAACACCLHVAYLCVDNARKVIEVAEEYADDQAGDEELAATRETLLPFVKAGPEYVPWLVTAESAYQAVSEVASAVPGCAAAAVAVSIEATGPEAESYLGTPDEARAEARADCVAALRCVFGNPYRKAAFSPAWRTSDAVALATGIYADRAFDRLPVLADALQDAGCDDPDALAHLRGDGPHFRGCWVLDLVLQKG